jgi:hypothetical protein
MTEELGLFSKAVVQEEAYEPIFERLAAFASRQEERLAVE